jgi:hypothetical protein
MSVRHSLEYLLESFSSLVDQTAVNPSSIGGCELSAWQLIFLQSKVNGAQYRGDEICPYRWDWPGETYFQKRVRYLRRVRMRPLNETSMSKAA